jgi:hypothetical protein
LGISGLFFAVSQGFLGEMPDVKELENPDIFVASEIISSDGVVLGKFEKEKTQPIVYKDLPPYLIYAFRLKKMNVLKNIQELILIRCQSCSLWWWPRWRFYHYSTVGKITFHRKKSSK